MGLNGSCGARRFERVGSVASDRSVTSDHSSASNHLVGFGRLGASSRPGRGGVRKGRLSRLG